MGKCCGVSSQQVILTMNGRIMVIMLPEVMPRGDRIISSTGHIDSPMLQDETARAKVHRGMT